GEGDQEQRGRDGEGPPGGHGQSDPEAGRRDPLGAGDGEGAVHLDEVLGQEAALVAGREMEIELGRVLPRIERAGGILTVHSSPPSTFSRARATPGGRGRAATRPCRSGSPGSRRCPSTRGPRYRAGPRSTGTRPRASGEAFRASREWGRLLRTVPVAALRPPGGRRRWRTTDACGPGGLRSPRSGTAR